MTLIFAIFLLNLIITCFSFNFDHRRVRLGVDYGPQLIGLAFSDLYGGASPYQTISNTGNLCRISEKVVQLAKYHGANEIVIGVPLDKDGILSYDVDNVNGKLCLDFSAVLHAVANHLTNDKIAVKIYDERYTTKEASLRFRSRIQKGWCK